MGCEEARRTGEKVVVDPFEVALSGYPVGQFGFRQGWREVFWFSVEVRTTGYVDYD